MRDYKNWNLENIRHYYKNKIFAKLIKNKQRPYMHSAQRKTQKKPTATLSYSR